MFSTTQQFCKGQTEQWKKHEVRSVVAGGVRVELLPGVFSPVELSSAIARRHNEKPFPEADLEPRKIGVLRIYPDDREYVLACIPVSWAAYVLAQELGKTLPSVERFHRLAVCVVVRTKDDQFVLMRRSVSGVENYPDVWHVSAAGYVEAEDCALEDALEAAVWRELKEETTPTPEDIDKCDMKSLGMCEHLTPGKSIYEVGYVLNAHLTAAEVLERASVAEDTWEGKHHAFSEEGVRQLLAREKFNPAGAAMLMTCLGI